MAIKLASIYQMNQHENRHFGIVVDRESLINAVIVGPIARMKEIIGRELVAKYELTTIDSVELDLPENNEVSGIYPFGKNQVLIDGRIHTITEIDDQFAMIDVYIQTDDNILSVTTDDFPRSPVLNSRVRILGQGLVVSPSSNNHMNEGANTTASDGGNPNLKK